MRSTQKSSSREYSVQQKSITREMQQSSIRSLYQSLIKQSLRESLLTRNFLRQSSSSSSQSSEISKILQNFYIRQSHSSKNFYIRQSLSSEKKSMLRQSFQSRFSKFYQSSQLSKQFYRRSTEYSSLVSFSSSISSRSFISKSFVSSSSSSSVNQSIKSSDYDEELINLTKLYSDETKYSEENDNFSFKLIMFNDMCDRIDVLNETKLKVFSIMLKKLALNYYYSNVINSKASLTFDDVCVSITNYFEDAEYRRSILNK